MSMFTLKLIAIISMLLDHMGYQFGIYIFRIIGRLAFPIFSYLVVNGFFKTRNRWKYLARMLVFAAVSEIPFDLCFRNSLLEWSNQNVFFTLSLGLLCLIVTDMIWKSKKCRCLCFLPALVCMGAAEYIGSDYGYAGVLMITAFYVCYDQNRERLRIIPAVLSVAAITLYPLAYRLAYDIIKIGTKVNRVYIQAFLISNSWQVTQLYRLFSLVLIWGYNGSRGYQFKNRFLSVAVKYGFYIFYPLHLILLYIFS